MPAISHKIQDYFKGFGEMVFIKKAHYSLWGFKFSAQHHMAQRYPQCHSRKTQCLSPPRAPAFTYTDPLIYVIKMIKFLKSELGNEQGVWSKSPYPSWEANTCFFMTKQNRTILPQEPKNLPNARWRRYRSVLAKAFLFLWQVPKKIKGGGNLW